MENEAVHNPPSDEQIEGVRERLAIEAQAVGVDRTVLLWLVLELQRMRRREARDVAFAKSADDEPIFCLRAQDCTAPVVIEQWLALQSFRGAEAEPLSDEKVSRARNCAYQMRLWQADTGRSKWPD